MFRVIAPTSGLRGKQLQRLVEFLAQRFRSFVPMLAPPTSGLFDVLRSPVREVNWKRLAHSRFRSARKTSSAGMVSPRSPSAIDSRSSASAAASSSKVSSATRARTVTMAPSGNGSPSTMIFPETTLPDVISIFAILARMRFAYVRVRLDHSE